MIWSDEALNDLNTFMIFYQRNLNLQPKFRLPLNDLTILTNKHGYFEKTVRLCDNYLQSSNLTDRQKEEILKRLEKAKEKLV